MPGRGVDRAIIADIGSDEHNATAIAVLSGRGFKARPALDDDVTVFLSCGQRGRFEGRGAIAATRNSHAGKNKLGVFIVEQAGANEVVIDWQGRGDKGPRVHLAGAAKDDAVGVDHINLTLGIDAAADLRGCRRGVENLVERDPLAGIGPAFRLVEVDRCVAPDIESLPVQNGLLVVLLDGDVIADSHRGIGPVPPGIITGQNLQSTWPQPVGHIVKGCGRGASCRLSCLHAL